MLFRKKIKKTFPKIALICAATNFAAGTIFAGETSAETTLEISSAEEFRAALEEESSGTTLEISQNFTIEISPESESSTIVPAATDFKIAGTSAETQISTSGSGDLLLIENLNFATVENLKISGSGTSSENADGRVFILSAGVLQINGNTEFSDRFFAATGTTEIGAAGGIIASESYSDVVILNTEDGEISFTNLTVFGGILSETTEVEDDDGEISYETETTILNATGAAIYLSGRLEISGTNAVSFSQNSAISEEGDALGGAIFVTNTSYSSDGSSVSYDAQSDDNYALFGFVASAGTQISFAQNSAIASAGTASGGAVFVDGGEFISQSATLNFEKNSAAGTTAQGGAIAFSNGARATFEAGTTLVFSENFAQATSEFSSASGGAIFVEDSIFEIISGDEISSATFSENSAKTEENGSSAYGGAIFVSGTDANFSASGSFEFSKNSASASGEISTEIEYDEDGEIESETELAPEAAGGAIAIFGGEFSLENASGTLIFSENSAETSAAGTTAQGGAIFASEDASSAIFTSAETTDFSGNFASASGENSFANGGAIAIFAPEFSFENAAGTLNFSENFASASAGTASGGAIFLSGTSAEISAETLNFSGNFASGTSAQGGAIFVENSTNLALSGTTIFSENFASGTTAQGGAIAILSGEIEISSSSETTFSGNFAEANSENSDDDLFASGGAIFLKNSGTLTISGTANFEENYASADTTNENSVASGGAIFSSGNLTFESATFSKNSASAANASGGAIHISLGNFSADEISFSENSATASEGTALGGAIYQALGTISFSSISAEGNFVDAANGSAKGGAIFSRGNLELSGTIIFSGNEAKSSAGTAFGGAIFTSGTLSISADEDSIFSENSASGTNAFGGFLAAQNATVEISGATISENSASGTTSAFGGAFYISGGKLEISNTTISENSVSGTSAAGGAIYLDASGTVDTELVLSGEIEISSNTANDESNGISFGNGAGETSNSNVKISISAAGECVKILDSILGELTGDAEFYLEKDDSDGDFIWAGTHEISVESGVFEIALNSGTTILQSGFSLSGTAISSLEISENATLEIEENSVLGNVSSLSNAGEINVFGALNFTGTTGISSGTINFYDNSTSEISGTNSISGAINIFGNVEFSSISSGSDDDSDDEDSESESGNSLEISALVLNSSDDGSAPNLTISSSGTTLKIYVEEIDFAASGTIEIDENTTILVETIAATNAEDGEISGTFSGAGTIVFLDETDEDGNIVFNSFYDEESGEYASSTFIFGSEISIQSGISITQNATVSLGNAGLDYKYVVISGGTLLAPETSEENPLQIYELVVTSAGATLGANGENQYFKLVENPNSTSSDDEDSDEEGDDELASDEDSDSDSDDSAETTSSTKSVSVAGNLEITGTTTLEADIALGNVYYAALNGEGTLVGDVSGSGSVGISKIDGDVNVASGRRLTFTNTDSGTEISGTISNNGTIIVSDEAKVSAEAWNNAGTLTISGAAELSGDFENSGTIYVYGDLTLAGTTFEQSAAGTISISADASVDFSNVDEVSLAGTIILDVSEITPGAEVQYLIGLDADALSGTTILTTSSVDISDRVIWSESLGNYVYLGVNGRSVFTTLYGDLTRENIYRIYNFLHLATLHKTVSSIKAPVFSEKKTISRYMKNYVENLRKYDPEAAKTAFPEIAEEENLGDYAKSFEKDLIGNAWIQAKYTKSHSAKIGENLEYTTTSAAAILGTSFKISEKYEVGAALAYENSTMKHAGTNFHKIETESGSALGFVKYFYDGLDFTFALAGSFASHDSNREQNLADFSSWQFGIFWENGLTFVPENYCEWRFFYGLETAYSKTQSGEESGAGTTIYDLKGGDGFSARARLGSEFAFLISDEFQVTIRAAAVYDFGERTYSTDGYDRSTFSDVVFKSHKNQGFGGEFGLFGNYRFSKNFSIFGGYAGTRFEHEEDHSLHVGLKISF